MAKVEIIVSRVCQIGDQIISQPAGTIIDVSDAEAESLIAAEHAVAVVDAADDDDKDDDGKPAKKKATKKAASKKAT